MSFASLRSVFDRQVLLMRMFYFFLLSLSLSNWKNLDYLMDLRVPFPTPLWGWMEMERLGYVGLALVFFFSLSQFFGFLLPRKRFARVLALVGLLLWGTFINSFGKVGHYYVLPIWVSLFLVFSPAWNHHFSRKTALNLRASFVYIQVLILLTYLSAGISKLTYTASALLNQQPSLLDLNGFNHILLKRSVQLGFMPFPGDFLIDYPILGWFGELSIVLLQMGALPLLIFLPSVGWLIGLILMSFHILALILLKADFSSTIFVIVLFLVLSPPPRMHWWRRYFAKYFLKKTVIDR